MASQISSNKGPGRSIVITPDDSSISLAQAIYHHVTTKTERILEGFRESYKVYDDDIVQLSHVIKQVAQRHHEGEWSCVIDHALFKRARTRFSSLERFRSSDKSQSEPTSEVVLTYDFLSTNPFAPDGADITPERYKVEIRITQEAYLSMLDEEDSRPRFISRLISIPSITVSIQYVDYTVARAILSAVREWVSSLDTSKQSRLSKFLVRNEFTLSEVFPAVLAACLLLGAAGVVDGISRVTWSFVFSSLALSVLFYGLGYLISESFINNFYALQVPTSILITKGDKTHAVNVDKRRLKAKKVVGFILITVVFAILVNVLSSFIYDWFIG